MISYLLTLSTETCSMVYILLYPLKVLVVFIEAILLLWLSNLLIKELDLLFSRTLKSSFKTTLNIRYFVISCLVPLLVSVQPCSTIQLTLSRLTCKDLKLINMVDSLDVSLILWSMRDLWVSIRELDLDFAELFSMSPLPSQSSILSRDWWSKWSHTNERDKKTIYLNY